MPNTLIIGGNGKVARHLTTHILATESKQPHQVYSLIRDASQEQSLKDLGANPIVQSIESASVSELSETFKHVAPTTVVFLAGAPFPEPHRTATVDKDGAIKVFDACAAAGIKRVISVSALDVRDREHKPVPDWYSEADVQGSERVWKVIAPWMTAKLAADRELRVGNEQRGLEYTMIRPGGLSDTPGVGTVSAGKVSLGKMVSREDVAMVVAECIRNRDTIGLAFDVGGGDTPIAEAVGDVVRARIDTFEGYY